MTPHRVQPKLAAIGSADVAGSSRLKSEGKCD